MILAGMLLDRLGAVTEVSAVPGGPFGFEVRQRRSLVPVELRPVQRTVALDIGHDHGRPVGHVEHLRETADGDVWLVASVERDLPADRRYLSAEYEGKIDHGVHGDARLVGVALTDRPAMRALPPVRIFEDVGLLDLDEAWLLRLRRSEPFLSDLIGEAARSAQERRYGGETLRVAKPPPTVERMGPGAWLVEGELVTAPLRTAVSSVAASPRSTSRPAEPGWYEDDDDPERPPGPLHYSAPYPGVLRVR